MADQHADFEQFWAVYPRHVAKKAAERAWKKINPDPALAWTIVAAVIAQCAELRARGVQYCPHPATWLNGERWLDETATTQKPLGSWRDHCDHQPTCGTPTICELRKAQAS